MQPTNKTIGSFGSNHLNNRYNNNTNGWLNGWDEMEHEKT